MTQTTEATQTTKTQNPINLFALGSLYCSVILAAMLLVNLATEGDSEILLILPALTGYFSILRLRSK
jgi:hypothetical protein